MPRKRLHRRRLIDEIGVDRALAMFDQDEPERADSGRHSRLAHWSDTLAEATVQALQGPVHRSWPGCPSSEACEALGVCVLTYVRARAVAQAKVHVYLMRARVPARRALE